MTTNDLYLLSFSELEARRDALLSCDSPRAAAELRDVEDHIEARLDDDAMIADLGASLYYGSRPFARAGVDR